MEKLERKRERWNDFEVDVVGRNDLTVNKMTRRKERKKESRSEL